MNMQEALEVCRHYQVFVRPCGWALSRPDCWVRLAWIGEDFVFVRQNTKTGHKSKLYLYSPPELLGEWESSLDVKPQAGMPETTATVRP